MGKGVEIFKPSAKPVFHGGRNSFGEAKEPGKPGKAVKWPKQKGFKRGNGKKKIIADEKTKRVKGLHGAFSLAEKEGGQKDDTTLSRTPLDSGEGEEPVKTDVEGTAGTQTACQGKRKRQVRAFNLRRKAPRGISRRKKRELAGRGVIYIAHLPLGFFEPQLKAFFSQFGEVSRVRLFRSRKSGHSKGYAFVEFGLREVAQIAAETLDKYRMFGRTLVCRLTDKGQIKNHVFRRCHKPFRRTDWQSLAAAQHNKPEGQRLSARGISAVANRLRKKAKLLHNVGIDIELPTVHGSAEEGGNLREWVKHERQELKAKKGKFKTKRI